MSVFVFVQNLTQSLWLVMGGLTHKDEIHANPNNLFTLMLLFKHGRPIRFPPAIQLSTPHISLRPLITCKQTEGLFRDAAVPMTEFLVGDGE